MENTQRAIDLGAHQRAIVAQLQQDQNRLAELDEERERVVARIHAGRGKLDLIADLATLGLNEGQIGRGGRAGDVKSSEPPST